MVLDANYTPSIPIGYIPYINRYLNPGRGLAGDPLSNNLYNVRIEGIYEDILCQRIDPPEVRCETFIIRQNNSPMPIYVPTSMSVGTMTLIKVVGIGNPESITGEIPPREGSAKITSNAFSDWVKQTREARESYGSNFSSSYRKTLDIYLQDNAGKVAAHWKAWDCIPISWTPFTALEGTTSALVTESIVIQPEGFERTDL